MEDITNLNFEEKEEESKFNLTQKELDSQIDAIKGKKERIQREIDLQQNAMQSLISDQNNRSFTQDQSFNKRAQGDVTTKLNQLKERLTSLKSKHQ